MPPVRVTKSSVQVLVLTNTETAPPARITKNSVQVLVNRLSETPPSVRVTKSSVQILVSTEELQKLKAWAYILN